MRDFLNEVFDGYMQFIEIYNQHKPPIKPYATYQVIFTDPMGIDTINREKSTTNENIVIETVIKQFKDTAQIDIYSDSINDCKEKAKEIILKLQYRYREILIDRGFSLENITQIKEIHSVGVSNVESRVSFNIIFSYSDSYSHEVENVNVVQFTAKESD